MKYRIEKDSLGKVKVPIDAYYGAQTQRAIENYPSVGLKLQKKFIIAQAIIKKAAAIANIKTGRLEKRIGNAIVKAVNEIINGKCLDQFILPPHQSGAGVSQNMNINEVITNRAIEILHGKKGNYKLIHPNDHVNMSQSTNDTIHSAIHIAAYIALQEQLIPALEKYQKEIRKKSNQFKIIVKSGRTHLQDAVPITLGQEFSGYFIQNRIESLKNVSKHLLDLPLGGTAVGTGINAHPKYARIAIKEINKITHYKFKQSKYMFASMQNLNVELEISGILKTIASSFIKVSKDLRLLSSGPVTGIGEIVLPALQPGSSIMPGKINPVMPEMMQMICYQVIGNDATITAAASEGELELNVMMPVVAYNLLNSIELLAVGIDAFTEKCIKGIKANEKRIKEFLEKNPIVVTVLTPYIGYEKAAKVAKRSYKENKSIKQIVLEMKLLPKEKLDKILDYKKMTKI